MDSIPSVSIALATYNGSRFIVEQLESIAEQTFKPLELIVSDDRSNDNTLEIVRGFAKTAGFRIEILNNLNRVGFGDNFLRAVKACAGDYIAFCDQDDIWHPDKLANAIEALERTGAALFTHNAKKIDQSGTVIGEHSHGMTNGLYERCKLPPWGVFFGFTCVFRRQIVEILPMDGRPFDDIDPSARLSHDRWIYFLANSFSSTLVSTEQLASYRQHSANVYGARYNSQIRKLKKFLFGYQNYLKKYEMLAQARVTLLLKAQARQPELNQWLIPLSIWQEQAQIFNLRLTLLRKNSTPKRMSSLRNLIRGHAYRPKKLGGLGFEGAAMDVLAFLLFL